MLDTSEDGIASELYAYIHKKGIPHKQVIVDIGANDGYEISNSYFFLETLGWTGYLVEPQPEMVPLMKTLHINNKANIFDLAISDKEGKFMLTCHPNDDRKSRPSEFKNMGASLTDRGGKMKWEVDVITFQQFLDRTGLREIDILSIDTEGHDINVIRSMLQTDVRPRFIITEVWSHEPDVEKAKCDLLDLVGYKEIIRKSSNVVYEFSRE